MRKRYTIVLIVLISSFMELRAQLLFRLYEDSLQAYTYFGGDEFNAPQLNEEEWRPDVGGRRVIMSQDLAFLPSHIKQEEGLIKFFATKRDSLFTLFDYEVDSAVLKKQKLTLTKNQFMSRYAAGGILSKKKYFYGLYEVRFKVEEGQGVWPAFWFQIGHKNEEIDVFELKGEKNNKIHVDTHCPYGCDDGYKNKLGFKTSYGGWLPLSGYLHDGFNIMSVEWKPDEIRWYINGYALAYFKGNLNHPFCVFLNTSVAKDGGPFKPGPSEETKWPNTYSVDYFRAWKKLDAGEACALNTNEDIAVSDKYVSTYTIKPTKKRGLLYKKSVLSSEQGFVSIVRPEKNRLIVTVTGHLNEPGAVVSIRHGLSGKEEALPPKGKEISITTGPGEKEILLSLRLNGKQHTQIIQLSE